MSDEPRFNLILIVNDDTGHGELGCCGAADLRTPHLDDLAAGGVRLTRYYTSLPVCSPARASILTGRYPQRVGVTGVLREEHDQTGMNLDEVTLADRLAESGYATGLIGKWHVGVGPGRRPNQRGFQEFYGALNGVIDYFTHVSLGGGLDGQPGLCRDGQPIEEEGYFTELVTREALDFIDRHRGEPFFLMLQPPPPHPPMEAPEEYLREFTGLPEARAVYAAMMACLDDGIGRILQRLDEHGLRDRTVIGYASDHGWVRHGRHRDGSDNGGLRGGKYYLTDGGLRVPAILSVPGWTPGVCDTPVIAMDLFPTLLALVGCPVPDDRVIDGVDLSRVLQPPYDVPERDLFWEFEDERVGTGPQRAALRGRWKLLEMNGRTELFDIVADPREERDLALERPEVRSALDTAWTRWYERLSEEGARWRM